LLCKKNAIKNPVFPEIQDLSLQEFVDGKWITVDTSNSNDSNDELIEYKVNHDGVFRLLVTGFWSSFYKYSIKDLIAFTYVIQKENN
ncbi:hypothetical protein, partial [Mycoplasma sp. 4423]